MGVFINFWQWRGQSTDAKDSARQMFSAHMRSHSPSLIQNCRDCWRSMLIHKCRRMTLQRPIIWRQRQEARKREQKASDSKELNLWVFPGGGGQKDVLDSSLGSVFCMWCLSCLLEELAPWTTEELGLLAKGLQKCPPFQRDRVFLCLV